MICPKSFASRSNVEPGVGQSFDRKSRPVGWYPERLRMAQESPGLFRPGDGNSARKLPKEKQR